jgi:hypothetical protein
MKPIPKAAPAPAEMPPPARALLPTSPAPAHRASPVNIRGLSTLGPPPPYRPIVQGAAEFARGPPPDLEPWRVASLSSIPVSSWETEPETATSPAATPVEPEDADWRLPRESAVQVRRYFDPDADERSLVEPVTDFPMAVPVIDTKARNVWPVLWAAATIALVLLAGAVLVAERRIILRLIVRIFAALGLVES